VTSSNVTVVFSAQDNFTSSAAIVVRNQQGQAPPFSYAGEGDFTVTLTAADLAGNFSTAAAHFIIDRTPPAAVGDLRVDVSTETGATTLTWSAPGGDPRPLAGYELRYRSAQDGILLNAANWASAPRRPTRSSRRRPAAPRRSR